MAIQNASLIFLVMSFRLQQKEVIIGSKWQLVSEIPCEGSFSLKDSHWLAILESPKLPSIHVNIFSSCQGSLHLYY